MKMEVFANAESTAHSAAEIIATEARAAVAARGHFVMAVSGGHTPWIMLRALASQPMPWDAVHVVQVDERVAPEGHPDRNLTHIKESLLGHCPLRSDQIYGMPVGASDLDSAANEYEATLRNIAGTPAVLDLAHLGLGPDGHTASLVPGDPVLDVVDREVGITGPYQGRQRMTLTYPILNRSRRVLWLITGEEKASMLQRLMRGDHSIPAGRVRLENSLIVADRGAARQLKTA